jgi:tetratricopeptide (TPR) repeat protein
LRGEEFLTHDDYENALKENKEALRLSGKNHPGDEALFNMGLLYSHYGYPQKDYKKSLVLFERLVKEYPRSPLVGEAKIWISVLEVIEKMKQVDVEIEKKKKELSR